MQAEICVDDSDEGHIRKVQTLGDHLCAHKDVDLAGAKGCERFAKGILPLHHIRVHPLDDGFGKQLGHDILDLQR